MTPARVIVVGGGVTGLSLGVTLQADAATRGVPLDLQVLEAHSQPGGHARTVRDRGFVVERGPNGFLTREPETLALVTALGLDARLVSANPAAARRFVVRNGRLCRVPESPLSLLTTTALSWRGKARLLGEPWAAGPPGGDETVFDFAERRIGREAAEVLVDTAVSGISAGDSRQLSVAAQFPLMVEMEREHGSLVRAMFARRLPKTGPAAGRARLVSFDAGMGVLTDAMAARLGPSLRCGAGVTGLARTGDAWRVTLASGAALMADHVVLATPARVSARMVQADAPALAERMREVSYAGLSVVALGYRAADIPRPLDGYGYLVTRPEGLATLGVVWESSLFPGRAPEGHVLLRVMLGGMRAPGMAVAPPEECLARARAELQQVLGVEAAPVMSAVFQWPDAIAQYTRGHLDRMQQLQTTLDTCPGLHLCGTSYDGVSFNHAVTSGRAMARRLLDERPRSGAAGRQTRRYIA